MATAIGVLIATAGWITLIVIAVFLLVVRLTRFVSLGTMIAICTAPLLYWLFGFSWQYILLGLGMALLVIGRHHENIGRLLQGKESKLGKKVNPVKPPARKG